MKKSVSGSSAEAISHRGTSRVRVRYAETDAMGWVYYANYFHYFEVGRSDLIRSIWMSYRKMEEQGHRLPVVEAGCEYLRGARYEDELDIESALTVPTPLRLRFDYNVVAVDSKVKIARGYTIHCFVNQDGKPVPVPQDLREVLTSR